MGVGSAGTRPFVVRAGLRTVNRRGSLLFGSGCAAMAGGLTHAPGAAESPSGCNAPEKAERARRKQRRALSLTFRTARAYPPAGARPARRPGSSVVCYPPG
ncbi:hypothetical protein GCM10027570_47830 [Streptomonospora sediminis]